jgi:hypothetical protein
MKRQLLIILLCFMVSLVAVSAQITITYPEDGVTYGPWSETYIDYARTEGKAHEFQMQVAIDNPAIAYYTIERYGALVREVTFDGTEGDVVHFAPDDLEPMTLVGFLSAVQDFTVVAYDDAGNEIGQDTIEFYIAVELEDYYEILESEPGFADEFVVRDEDLSSIDVTIEEIEVTEGFYVTVRNRFTDETEEHTRVKVTIEPRIPGAADVMLDVYAFIPKEVVETLSGMTLEGEYNVIDVDPVMMWNFAAGEDTNSFEFDVNERLEEEAIREISTVAVSDVEVSRTKWYFLIPLVAPIVLLFGIVYFSKFKRRE